MSNRHEGPPEDITTGMAVIGALLAILLVSTIGSLAERTIGVFT